MIASSLKKTSRVILKKKTASVILRREKNDECNGKKNGECLQSWPFSVIVRMNEFCDVFPLIKSVYIKRPHNAAGKS
jgi:hypothetical protein